MIWLKKDGQEIELNELPETEKEAKRLGWKKSSVKDEAKAKQAAIKAAKENGN